MGDIPWYVCVIAFFFTWSAIFGYALWAREWFLITEQAVRQLRREFGGRP